LIEIKPPGGDRRSVVFMELLASIAAMGAALRAVFGDASPVLLEQVLRRQGDDVARRAVVSGDRNFADAIRQCTRCTQAAQCRAWLYSGAHDGYQSFCPNAGFVHRMKVLTC